MINRNNRMPVGIRKMGKGTLEASLVTYEPGPLSIKYRIDTLSSQYDIVTWPGSVGFCRKSLEDIRIAIS